MPAFRILALAALALAACTPANTPVSGPGDVAPSGGTAGPMGEAYCEKTPTDPNDLANWEQVCQPGGRR